MAITGIGASALGVDPAIDKKAAAAAGQFESLLIAQMLKSMRESESGWLGTGEEDSASDSAMSMAEEHFASAMSAAGGFGLAKVVNAGLKAPGLSGNLNVATPKL